MSIAWRSCKLANGMAACGWAASALMAGAAHPTFAIFSVGMVGFAVYLARGAHNLEVLTSKGNT